MHHNVPRPLLQAAREAADRGWHVFPLIADTKRPAISSWGSFATTYGSRIDRWWAAGKGNIGVATGPSRLVVIDLDVPKHDQDRPPADSDLADGQDAFARLAEQHGQPYPGDTYTVRTRSGGRQLYFAAPLESKLRNTAGSLGWKIDTRAHGGYVVGAGSIVDGRLYTVAHDVPPAPLPEWIAELLAPAPLPPQALVSAKLAAFDLHSAYLRAAVDGELKRVTRAKPGARNNALYIAAVALGQLVAGHELNASDVTDWLTAVAVSGGQTRWEAEATIASGLRAGAKRPRTLGWGAA
ncbi:bifunctional DNA primase/polymerase [Kitasatospora camelliae]|uniref:Bifunctional DNA primase/polymerase n=1 Tax=Kitasatospora camelliae TaxID=3156397 RepID=A0AAU8K1K5_9ACTN